MRFRVTAALKQLLCSQIECRDEATDRTPGISVYRKLGAAAGYADLTAVEASELKAELDFWLMPEQEKYPGEERCARAAKARLEKLERRAG